MSFLVPSVHVLQRRAGRVAGSGSGWCASSRAHGRSSRLRSARRERALALSFGDTVGQRVALLVPREQAGYLALHRAARVDPTVHRAFRFAGERGPNPAVNTDARRRGFARAAVAGYLTR